MTSPTPTSACVVLIPIYRENLPADEAWALEQSLKRLAEWPIRFFGPEGLKIDWYLSRAPKASYIEYPKSYFISERSYSQLLLSQLFYEPFSQFEYHLICQTDAIVLRSDLATFIAMDYDYWGAPWPKGWSIDLPIHIKGVDRLTKLQAFVGNGGLSLRKTQKIQSLLDTFPESLHAWKAQGNPEDVYISLFGSMVENFRIPNIRTATKFAIELEPEFMLWLNGGIEPFGVHQWQKYGYKIVCAKEKALKRK